MEFKAENLQTQVSVVHHATPNQEISLLNEDTALTTEKIIEEPDSITIEKQTVIHKKVIKKEKISLPRPNVLSLQHQPSGSSSSFFTDENARFVYNEDNNQDDSPALSSMEISGQESADSLDSPMNISRQVSVDSSKMDISSQGSSSQDSDLKPKIDVCVPIKRKVFKRRVSSNKERSKPYDLRNRRERKNMKQRKKN